MTLLRHILTKKLPPTLLKRSLPLVCPSIQRLSTFDYDSDDESGEKFGGGLNRNEQNSIFNDNRRFKTFNERGTNFINDRDSGIQFGDRAFKRYDRGGEGFHRYNRETSRFRQSDRGGFQRYGRDGGRFQGYDHGGRGSNRFDEMQGLSRHDQYDYENQTPFFEGEDVAPISEYQEHPDVTNRSMEEIAEFFKTHDIKCQGEDVPKPVFTFEEANFPDYVYATLMQQNFPSPTAIQSLTWPAVMSGKDVIGIAHTGSGKTLGFMLPAIIHAMNTQDNACRNGPICLVMTPTRELCQQIAAVAAEFAKMSGITIAELYGGANRDRQIRKIRKFGAQIIIATPGRLNDVTAARDVSLHQVTYLVLDEADRMLDMGFKPQIEKVVQQIRKNRQTLMWSATWPREIQMLAARLLRNPIEMHVGQEELVVNPDIHQILKVVNPNSKLNGLVETLKEIYNPENMREKDPKILIFTKTKRMADQLSYRMFGAVVNNIGTKIYCESIHSDKSQSQRDKIIRDFRSGRLTVVVGTALASRGIDVNDITHVINFDQPDTAEEYVHRVGRTGRGGKKGVAVTLIDNIYESCMKQIVELLKNSGQEIPHELKHFESLRSRGGKSFNQSEPSCYNCGRAGHFARECPNPRRRGFNTGKF